MHDVRILRWKPSKNEATCQVLIMMSRNYLEAWHNYRRELLTSDLRGEGGQSPFFRGIEFVKPEPVNATQNFNMSYTR